MNIEYAQLGQVSTLQAGIGFPLNLQGRKNGLYPFAKVGDISRGGRSGNSILATADHYVDEGDVTALRAKLVPKGSVLFAKIGEAIRQNHRVIAGCQMLIDNNAMAAIPGVKIDGRFLYHYLKTVDFYCLAPATTVPALRKSDLERLLIPLPALPEQRRIAAILDQADALRAKRREALVQLDSLTQSIFIDMFGDPVMNSKGWADSLTLGDVADIASGITKGRKLTGKTTRTVPYLAVANVQDKSLNVTVVKEIEATEDEILRYQLRTNDLLLTEGGDPDKLGRGALWNDELPQCIHQNHIFRVRLTSEKLTPLFLNWLVGSQRGKKFFLRSAKQTTGIASINMRQLRSFPLLLPPIELQQEFTILANGVAEQYAACTASLAELGTLFASLQHRAYRGEL